MDQKDHRLWQTIKLMSVNLFKFFSRRYILFSWTQGFKLHETLLFSFLFLRDSVQVKLNPACMTKSMSAQSVFLSRCSLFTGLVLHKLRGPRNFFFMYGVSTSQSEPHVRGEVNDRTAHVFMEFHECGASHVEGSTIFFFFFGFWFFFIFDFDFLIFDFLLDECMTMDDMWAPYCFVELQLSLATEVQLKGTK